MEPSKYDFEGPKDSSVKSPSSPPPPRPPRSPSPHPSSFQSSPNEDRNSEEEDEMHGENLTDPNRYNQPPTPPTDDEDEEEIPDVFIVHTSSREIYDVLRFFRDGLEKKLEEEFNNPTENYDPKYLVPFLEMSVLKIVCEDIEKKCPNIPAALHNFKRNIELLIKNSCQIRSSPSSPSSSSTSSILDDARCCDAEAVASSFMTSFMSNPEMNAILRRCNDGGDHGEKSRNEDPEGEASGSLTEKEMNAIFQFNKKVLGDKMLDGMPKK